MGRRITPRLAVLAGCTVAGGALLVASRSEAFVEFYARRVGPAVSVALGRVTGFVPLSVAEVVLAASVLWLLVSALRGLVRVLRGRRRIGAALGAGGLRLLTFLAVAVTLFYALWGVQYARPPLAERLGWGRFATDVEEPVAELERLCRELVATVNGLHRELTRLEASGVGDAGGPDDLDAALDAAFVIVGGELGLHPSFARRRGPAKPLLASPLASALRLTGFYFPWTGEANYNADAPRWQRAHAMAHEKAHARGAMHEDEAHFLGFLACARSADPFLCYAGNLFAQRHLLMQLARYDRELARELVALREPGVQADVDEVRAFWKRHEGVLGRAAEAVNDRFLRLNAVPGGIESYGRVARLLVLFARSRGGSLR